MAIYESTMQKLIHLERIYPCVCSRSDVQGAASAPHAGHDGPIYSGRCAHRTACELGDLLNRPYAWRFRTSDQIRSFTDRVAGLQQCNVNHALGDFVIGKSGDIPAYQLAVVVDDHEMGVTDVLRGDDLIPSAFRQLEIYDTLNWTPPQFAHAPLVVGPDGRRLAKRHGDTRISLLRDAGMSAQKLVGLLAFSCGLQPTPTPVMPHQLLADFDLNALPKDQFVFTDPMWHDLISA